MLGDKATAMNVMAIRFIDIYKGLLESEQPIKWLKPANQQFILKKDVTVDREYLCWLRKHNVDDDLVHLFFALANLYDGHDHFYRAALNIACGTDPQRRAKILADFDNWKSI
jgi:hypothetical protein